MSNQLRSSQDAHFGRGGKAMPGRIEGPSGGLEEYSRGESGEYGLHMETRSNDSSDRERPGRLEIEDDSVGDSSEHEKRLQMYEKAQKRCNRKIKKIKKHHFKHSQEIRRIDALTHEQLAEFGQKFEGVEAGRARTIRGYWQRVIHNALVRYFPEDAKLLKECVDLRVTCEFDSSHKLTRKTLRMYFGEEQTEWIRNELREDHLWLRLGYEHEGDETRLRIKSSRMPTEFYEAIYKTRDQKESAHKRTHESFFDLFLPRDKVYKSVFLSNNTYIVNNNMLSEKEVEQTVVKLHNMVNYSFMYFIMSGKGPLRL